jgi:ArsR family transcriptional regulator
MEVKELSKVFKAMSDETRLKILACLTEREELCVCEFQELLGLSQPTVSRHLKILEEAGFLKNRREGQWVIYRLKKENKIQIELSRIVDEALKEDPELAALITKAKEINLRDG